ncbi:unnamed protein product [Paramecium sonneborni]|uniref:Uncharacterized protein n=1 Tax=Paramecium sonneborni TaxID=65129 RepID=A0A8S1RTT8_9CILI|nr:unnamed protein product [Paramecium sonneborni]
MYVSFLIKSQMNSRNQGRFLNEMTKQIIASQQKNSLFNEIFQESFIEIKINQCDFYIEIIDN